MASCRYRVVRVRAPAKAITLYRNEHGSIICDPTLAWVQGTVARLLALTNVVNLLSGPRCSHQLLILLLSVAVP